MCRLNAKNVYTAPEAPENENEAELGRDAGKGILEPLPPSTSPRKMLLTLKTTPLSYVL